MREIKLYFIEFVLAAVACVTLLFLTNYENGVSSENYIEWDNGWMVTSGGKILSNLNRLEKTYEVKDGKLVLSRVLTLNDCGDNNTLVFMTVHMKVHIMIDGKCVYSTYSGDITYSKSRGHNWNCLDMYPEYIGKELRIELEYPYKAKEIAVPTLYLGNDLEITSDFIKNNSLSFMISLFMILIGLLLMIVYISLGKDSRIERRLIWIGWFSVALGIWSITETNVLILYMQNTLLLSQLAFISLKLTLTPVMMFYKETFKDRNSKFLLTICYISLADIVLTTILQALGIADYKETVWITHIYLAIGVGYIASSLFRNSLLSKDKEVKKVKNTINTIGITLMSITVVIDFARYYLSTDRSDAARFSRIGLLIYILTLGVQVIKNSLHLIDVENEAERLKQEALLDPVTHLGNRNAFDLDVSKIPAENREQYGIVMCDLNGLKYFNDHYGHSMGDSYIIISAEMICDAFSTCGKIYRVGGDEFVVLTTGLTEEEFPKNYNQMNEKIDSLNKSCFEERMGIAAGFAIFDKELDGSLRDTEKRADEKMYLKKSEMKAQNALLRRTEDALSAEGVQVENPLLKKNNN